MDMRVDIFIEQIVKKKSGAREAMILFGASALAVFLMFAVAVINFGLLAFTAMGVGYGLWQVFHSQSIEFEYAVTNGDIDIDRITGKRRRKRMVSVAGAKVERFERHKQYDRYGGGLDPRQFDRYVMAAAVADHPDNWCFTYRSKKSGHTLVVFSPDERVLEGFVKGLPRPLRSEVQKTIHNQ